MSHRSKRATKVRNYSDFETAFSDDDFVDATPPKPKKKETKVKKADKYTKNKVITPLVCSSESTSEIFSKRRNPKERISTDQKRYEEELKQALSLSTVEVNECFNGFTSSNNEKKGEVDATSPLRNSVLEVEVHSAPPGCDNVSEVSNIEGEERNNVTLQEKGSEECVPFVPTAKASIVDASLPVEKRQRKKVNFIEDDSDSLSKSGSSDSESEKNYSFEPSPPKKKQKKKTVKTSTSKNSNINKVPNKSITNIKNNSTSHIDLPSKIPEISNPSPNSNITATPNNIKSLTVVNGTSTSAKPSFNIVKTPFKSPGVSPSVPNSTSPSSKSKIGLRLGLSRKAFIKPLHPNATVK